MFIVEKFNKKFQNEYFAIMTPKEEMQEMQQEKPLFIRVSDEGMLDEVRAIRDYEIMFLPNVISGQRDAIMSCGKAGLGKSWLMNKFAQLYRMINPDNEILYLTTNDFEADTSLNHKIYTPVDMRTFLVQLHEAGAENYASSDAFNNKLICIDDIGGVKDKQLEKLLYDFMDIVLENMRKKNVSFFLNTHVPTAGAKTRTIVREIDKYIVYPRAQQVNSDRMLNHYLGLRKEHIRQIVNLADRWACNDTLRRLIITPSRIYKLHF